MSDREIINAIRRTLDRQPNKVLMEMYNVYYRKAQQDTPDQAEWLSLVDDIRKMITDKGGRIP